MKNSINEFNTQFAINHKEEISKLPISQQFDIYEKMLELEGLAPIDTFEAILTHDLILDEITETQNKWAKVNSAISAISEARAIEAVGDSGCGRPIGTFNTMVACKKALQVIKEEFPNDKPYSGELEITWTING